MARNLGRFGWVLVGLGLLLGYLGGQGNRLGLVGAGLLVGGAGLILEGVKDVLSRQVDLTDSYQGRFESYRGAAAVLHGMMWIILGGVAVIAGGSLILGQGETALVFFQQHPGPLLFTGGAVMVTFGGSSVLGAGEDRLSSSFWNFLGSLPARFVGLLIVLLGISAMVLGSVEMLFPAAYQQFVSQSLSLLRSRLGL